MKQTQVQIIASLIPPKRSESYAYRAGFDCGLNGANEKNCHFAIFSSKENTLEWERGKRNGEEKRKKAQA